MNNAGQMVGDAGLDAFFWDGSEAHQLPGLRPGQDTSANDISETGLIAGASSLTSDLAMPVMWVKGRIVALGLLESGLGGTTGGINDSGTIVGTASVREGMYRREMAFVWQNHVMHDLNDLALDGANERWDIMSGRDINTTGQIAALAYSPTRNLNLVVRLDPVDEGLTVWSFAPNQPGASNTLEVVHATPRGRVVFVAGTARGEARDIPQCPGATMQLVNPQVIGTAIADVEGRATLTRFIPASLAGRRFVVQAIDWSTCAASPPGFIQIQP